MKKKLISILLCAVTAATLVLGCSTSESSSTSKSDADKPKDKGANPEDYQVVMIVKQSDSWFDDMATGIDQLTVLFRYQKLEMQQVRYQLWRI